MNTWTDKILTWYCCTDTYPKRPGQNPRSEKQKCWIHYDLLNWFQFIKGKFTHNQSEVWGMGQGQWHQFFKIYFLKVPSELSFWKFFTFFFNPEWERNPVMKMPKIGPFQNYIFGRRSWQSGRGDSVCWLAETHFQAAPCSISSTVVFWSAFSPSEMIIWTSWFFSQHFTRVKLHVLQHDPA